MQKRQAFGKEYFDSMKEGAMFVWEMANGKRVVLKKIKHSTPNYKTAAGVDENGVKRYIPFHRVRTIKTVEYLFSKFKK